MLTNRSIQSSQYHWTRARSLNRGNSPDTLMGRCQSLTIRKVSDLTVLKGQVTAHHWRAVPNWAIIHGHAVTNSRRVEVMELLRLDFKNERLGGTSCFTPLSSLPSSPLISPLLPSFISTASHTSAPPRTNPTCSGATLIAHRPTPGRVASGEYSSIDRSTRSRLRVDFQKR